jgi:hypothetical protein
LTEQTNVNFTCFTDSDKSAAISRAVGKRADYIVEFALVEPMFAEPLLVWSERL